MNKNKKNKKKGYLLMEILISLFIFSILMFTLTIYLKRLVIIEKNKYKTHQKDEYIFNIFEKIYEIVKNRDKMIKIYENINENIIINEKYIILKKENYFYKLEIINNILYISDGESLNKLGGKSELGIYENIKFEKIDNFLLIKVLNNKKEIIKIVNLK